MKRVKATREGLLGGRTASGYQIESLMPFVALPSVRALRRFVIVRNPLNGRQMYAIVLDVGPWNIDDDEYVFGEHRPQSETGVDKWKRKTNGAGIDLSEALWKGLGMTGNTEVEWQFLDSL
jgi:hypothetical protein